MRHIVVIASILLLSACNNLQALKEKKPEANDFNGSLASEYLGYAESRAELGYQDAAEHFAGKGLDALHGESVAPDAVGDGLAESFKKPLIAARASLMSITTSDIKRVAPQKLARAQMMYDCWQHQVTTQKSSSPCREEFESTMVGLERVADTFAYNHEKKHPLVFADKRAALDDDMKAAVAAIAASVSALPRYKIALSAYDGSSKAARHLAQRRMQAVRLALLRAGVGEARIEAINKTSDKEVYISGDDGDLDKNQVTITVKTMSEQESPTP